MPNNNDISIFKAQIAMTRVDKFTTSFGENEMIKRIRFIRIRQRIKKLNIFICTGEKAYERSSEFRTGKQQPFMIGRAIWILAFFFQIGYEHSEIHFSVLTFMQTLIEYRDRPKDTIGPDCARVFSEI